MGMIRGAIDKTSSMKDIGLSEPRPDSAFAGDPATGHKYRDRGIDIGEQSDLALDSSRSRGYGRYEI
jgi:hypothetical protein